MRAREIINECRRHKVALAVTGSRRVAFYGPTAAVRRLEPDIRRARRAIVEILESEAEEERARLLQWWRQPVAGWPQELRLHNIARDESVIIDLRET